MKNKKDRFLTGFTLLEILIVIAIMGLLASVVIINSSRGMEQSRDSRRIQEIYQIAHSLMVYYTTHNEFPANTNNDYSLYGAQWDVGNSISQPASDTFVNGLVTSGVLSFIPKEWANAQDAHGTQNTYRYTKMVNPCNCPGTYAILYAACESEICPTNERPACCNDPVWIDGTGTNDASDIFIFLKEQE